MFNNLKDFSDWVGICKGLEGQVLQDLFKFIEEFPMADFEDYVKASEKLVEGYDVEKIIKSFAKHSTKSPEDEYVEVVAMKDVENDMWESMEKGALKGSTTHIPLIDKAWMWRESEFSLFTGYNNDGKSLFLRYLCLVKGIMDGWKTAIYAPEDFPAISFFDEIVHTASGYSTDRENERFIGKDLFQRVFNQIKDLFYFVNIRPPHNTLENILASFIPLIEKQGVKTCIIDPLVKITRPKEFINNDAQWAAYVTLICTDFARRYNINLILVLHQLTPKLQENGTYAKPDKYSIKSGGNLSDSSDNVLFLQRPDAPANMISTRVIFGSLKIKKQKLVAIPQEVGIEFNRKTNRYIDEMNKKDLFDFDNYLDIPKINLLFLK